MAAQLTTTHLHVVALHSYISSTHSDCSQTCFYSTFNQSTVLPQIMARVFIFFQQLFTPATKRDRRLRVRRLLFEVLNQSFSGYEF